jgi:hypothetical protein
MKALFVAVAILLVPWPAWSTSCTEQLGETIALELVDVTVDGEAQGDLSNYDGYNVTIENVVEDEAGGPTLFVDFLARRDIEGPGGETQIEGHQEFYGNDAE